MLLLALLVHVALLVSSVTNCIASEISVPSVIFRDSIFFVFEIRRRFQNS